MSVTEDDIPAERVLTAAIDNGLDRVIVIGVRDDGRPYWATSSGDAQLIIEDASAFIAVIMQLAGGDYEIVRGTIQ